LSADCSSELRSRTTRSRRGRARCPRAQTRRLSCLGGAPGEEEEDRRAQEALGSPSTTNSSGDACRRADLRRGNLSSLAARFEERKGEEREEDAGYL
jgi:hypothetical protein